MDYQVNLIIVFGLMPGVGSRRHLPPLIWAALIVVGSSVPNLSGLESRISVADKVMHFAEYFVLGFLASRAFLRSGEVSPRKAAGLIIAVAAFGVLDELHQRFVPGRKVEALDMAANVFGSFSSIMVYGLLAKRKKTGRGQVKIGDHSNGLDSRP